MVYQKEYSWRVPHGVEAKVVGEVMERIEERDGKVTKEAFLEESRPEDSPTHKCFEWDDGKAAEKYRLSQAQRTILDLQVKIISDETKVKSPAYVKVTVGEKKKASYVNVATAMETDKHRKVVLQNALAELKEIENKYKGYVELEKVFVAIHEFERGV